MGGQCEGVLRETETGCWGTGGGTILEEEQGGGEEGKEGVHDGKSRGEKGRLGNAVDGGMLYFYLRERTAQQHGDACDLRRMGSRAGRVACECCRCMRTGRH